MVILREMDGGEPEDQSFYRDWRWVPDALRAAYALGFMDGSAPSAALRARVAELEARLHRIQEIADDNAPSCDLLVRIHEVLDSDSAGGATERLNEEGYERRVAELEALRVAVGRLIDANDEARGLDRPRPDIAWRDVKRAYADASRTEGGGR